MKKLKSNLLTLLLSCSLYLVASNDMICILCIGNSFSLDAVEQELAPLCQAAE
jgi:hypothetical protein